jgi:hypothetical protein
MIRTTSMKRQKEEEELPCIYIKSYHLSLRRQGGRKIPEVTLPITKYYLTFKNAFFLAKVLFTCMISL